MTTDPKLSDITEQASIANRAMKFKLSRGGTQKRVRDRDAETLVKQQLGDEGQIVSRELFTDKNSPVYQYQQVANEMYGYHVKATLPYGDDSSRLLPNASYFDYTSKMQGFISKLEGLKQGIIANWDTLVATDVAARNTRLSAQGKTPIAKVEDYPTVQQMDYKLYVRWYPEPVSTSGDFRFDLPQDMKDATDAAYKEAIEVAARDRFNRMLKPVSAFIDKLNKFTGEKGQRWHDSYVDNLNALSKEIPALNIVDDPAVDGFLAQIQEIIQPYAFAPGLLKDDDNARARVKSKLQELENQLKGYTF
jgi:hypothetical protein